MDNQNVKPLNEMSLDELLDVHEDCIVWMMENTMPSDTWENVFRTKKAVRAEVQRREDRQRFGAMFAQKVINREEDGEILYA